MNKQELNDKLEAALAAYHAKFEIVRTPLGYRAQHKVTGQSYQAHDIAQGPQRQVE